MKILSVVEGRPNFMKVAPLQRAFGMDSDITSKVVHTGQHYDQKMSDVFFNQLELPTPDYYLGVGSGSHAEITAKIMIEFEKIVHQEMPDLVLVVGDVNSTLACALVTKKLNIKLAHVESGLRSGDRDMPEEINRIIADSITDSITDSISDYLFVTEQSGMVHLAKEWVADEKIFFVGNVMIDSLCDYREKATQLNLLSLLKLNKHAYNLITMHRPSNVDKAYKLEIILKVVKGLSQKKKTVFPLHPRTHKNLEKYHLLDVLKEISGLIILEPQGYLGFLQLMDKAEIIVTDSGVIKEEPTFLKVPCLTIRDSTERPVTIMLGNNISIPELDADLIIETYTKCLSNGKLDAVIRPLWDGKSAEQIAHLIHTTFKSKNHIKVADILTAHA